MQSGLSPAPNIPSPGSDVGWLLAALPLDWAVGLSPTGELFLGAAGESTAAKSQAQTRIFFFLGFVFSLSLFFFFKGELGRLPAPAAKNLLGFFRRRWLAPRLSSPGLSFPPLTLPGLPASSRPAVGRVRAPSQSIRRQAGRPLLGGSGCFL